MNPKRVIIWHRNDLRLHDHEPLSKAASEGATILPLYCISDKILGKTSLGFPKYGYFRYQFLTEALQDLKQSYSSYGVQLLFRKGAPHQILTELVNRWQADAVYYYYEPHLEALEQETEALRTLESLNITVKRFYGSTMIHKEDLPWSPEQYPDNFMEYYKRVSASLFIRSPLEPPTFILSDNSLESDLIPSNPNPKPQTSLPILNFPERLESMRHGFKPFGGEKIALERVKQFFDNEEICKNYSKNRNKLYCLDLSTRLSPSLAIGCITPRLIYHELTRVNLRQNYHSLSESLLFELYWRDFFQFMAYKHGEAAFCVKGSKGISIDWQENRELFTLWQNGETGYPLIDACMNELACTGYMPFRARANAASFLVKNLHINWTWGAEFFQSSLIDHDFCSNYGNWSFIAGVGADAKDFNYYHVTKQLETYDPNGEYVRAWLPQFNSLPTVKIFKPWALSSQEQTKYGFKLDVDYPRPITDIEKSAQKAESLYKTALRNANIKTSSKSKVRMFVKES